MTGRLRRLDGPEFMADHDRRIAALERRLRVSQTDLPRRQAAGTGPSIAFFNDSNGLLSDSGCCLFNQVYTLGDTSWFEFPFSQGFDDDQSRIRIVSPGIITVTFHALTTAFEPYLTVLAGSNDHIARSDGTPVGANSCAGVGVFQADVLDSSEEIVRGRVENTLGANAYGQLSITFHPGEPVVTTY